MNSCYHYRAFRYGGLGNNLYEDYIVGLSNGADLDELRASFAGGILRNRPRTMGEALGIELEDWPIWRYPWDSECRGAGPEIEDPKRNPDVVSHSSPAGVLVSHINREFAWLEAAFENIRTGGYRPGAFGYIQCLELRSGDGSSFIVTDGNHRLSALHALGLDAVAVQVRERPIARSDVATWPAVARGGRRTQDALAIFDRYFALENPPLATLNEAALIVDEAPLWPM